MFLSNEALNEDAPIKSMKKEILQIMIEFISLHHKTLKNYLPDIKNSALMIFKKDRSPTIKENCLKLLNLIIRVYDAEVLEKMIDCQSMTNMFLDEIKFLRPKATVKGRIWSVLGSLTEKFPEKMTDFQVEIQDVMFRE